VWLAHDLGHLSSVLGALAVAAGAVGAARCNLSTRSELVVVDAES